MNDEQVRSFLIVGALLSGLSGSTGFVAGRMSAPVLPFEVRYVPIPPPAGLSLTVPPAPIEPTPVAPVESAPLPAIEPPAESVAPVETKPLPAPRPKVEAKSKPRPEPAAKKPRMPARKASLPSCAVVKREYEAMTWPQRMDAYRKASAEEIAHGKRCLGF